MKSRPTVMATLVVLLSAYTSAPAHAQHGGHGTPAASAPTPAREGPYAEKLRIGEDGTVAFSAPTVVGELLFKPGRYRFEHAAEGEEHFVGFSSSDAPSDAPPAARAKCRLERLKKPAKKTEVRALVQGNGWRLVEWIQVRGESVRHAF